MIQRLPKRIDQLEASQKVIQEKIDHMGAAAPAAQPPEAAATPATETVEAQPEAPLAHVLGPVQLHGFSNFDYGRAWFEKLPPGGLKGSTNFFSSGDFDGNMDITVHRYSEDEIGELADSFSRRVRAVKFFRLEAAEASQASAAEAGGGR